MDVSYLPRLVDPLISELLSAVPAVLLVGPRATGKTTSALRHAKTVINLDREDFATAFRADPDSALDGLPEPVLLDEWQNAPGVLGAVKRTVDRDPRPGRFLITGSVRADLETIGWPAMGRVLRVPMYGLTEREIVGNLERVPFLDRLATGDLDDLQISGDAPDLRAYVQTALRGGFPELVLRVPEQARARWLEAYLEQALTRDPESVGGGGRDPDRLRRYFETLAVNTAGLAEQRTLFEAAGVSRATADAYERLFRNLVLIDSVPAWWTNRLKRLVKGAKRYVVDPALVAAVLRLDPNGVLFDANLLGRILDTYVMSQLRAEATVCATKPRIHHLRVEQGRREVDIVIEYGGGVVAGIEVKAGGAPDTSDARHLSWLRDELGGRFVAGVILHTGAVAYDIDARIRALPIRALWG